MLFGAVLGDAIDLFSKEAMAEGEISITEECEGNDLNVISADGNAVISEDITLEEKDIPGAWLPKPVEQCSMAILKRWLSCRGAKVSGKKGDLVQR